MACPKSLSSEAAGQKSHRCHVLTSATTPASCPQKRSADRYGLPVRLVPGSEILRPFPAFAYTGWWPREGQKGQAGLEKATGGRKRLWCLEDRQQHWVRQLSTGSPLAAHSPFSYFKSKHRKHLPDIQINKITYSRSVN